MQNARLDEAQAGIKIAGENMGVGHPYIAVCPPSLLSP